MASNARHERGEASGETEGALSLIRCLRLRNIRIRKRRILPSLFAVSLPLLSLLRDQF